MLDNWRRMMGGMVSPSSFVVRCIIAGLVIRLVLAPWTSFPYDTFPFYGSAVGSLSGVGPYGNALFSYPPLYAVLTYPLVQVLSWFMDPSTFGVFIPSMVEVSRTTGMLVPFVTAPELNLVLKTPLILGDLLVGLAIMGAASRWRDEKTADRLFALWFLNPLVIFVSSMHGQFDVLAAYCALIGVLMFMNRSYFLSGLALGLGVLFKVFPVYVIMVCLVSLTLMTIKEIKGARTFHTSRHWAMFIAGGAFSLISVLPFLLGPDGFLDFVLRRGTYSAIGGLNMWFLAPLISALSPGNGGGAGGFPLGTFTTIMGALLAIAISALILTRESEDDGRGFLRACTMALVAVLLTQAVTNPQYLIWVLPLMLLLSIDRPRTMEKVYLLSVIGLLYVISLQSGFALFYPWAQSVGVPSVETLNGLIMDYYEGTRIVRLLVVTTLGGLGALVLSSILLPQRLDPIAKLVDRLRSWRGSHAQ